MLCDLDTDSGKNLQLCVDDSWKKWREEKWVWSQCLSEWFLESEMCFST